jgi:hypothetical protein
MIIKLLFNILLIYSNFNSSSTDYSIKRYMNLENETELVVVFENYNSKFHDEVTTQINQINGIKSKGYCESLNCFYFELDSTVFKNSKEAFLVLESRTKKFVPVFKEGTTSAMVVLNCQRN